MAESVDSSSVSLGEAIQQTLDDVVRQIVDYAPEVIGAALTLLIGWIVAKTLSVSTRKLAQSLDSLAGRYWKTGSPRSGFRHSYGVVISKFVFWAVMIFFLAVASNILGWGLFSGWMQQVFSYLPGIITGILIIIGGLILGNFARSAVMTAGEKDTLHHRAFVGKLTQVVILFSAILIGVDQIGLNIGFLSNLVVTIVGILLAGASLAFGLGSRNLIANVIGSRYLQRHCETGDIVRIGGIEGEVIEIAQASVVIQTAEGKAVVPAGLFHEEVTLIQSNRT